MFRHECQNAPNPPAPNHDPYRRVVLVLLVLALLGTAGALVGNGTVANPLLSDAVVTLPEQNVTAVFEQMRAERRQFAARCQGEGEREATLIRSEAELEAARIRAKGAAEEARIRGESAAEIARTYADAHRTDPELYRFPRSLVSQRQAEIVD